MTNMPNMRPIDHHELPPDRGRKWEHITWLTGSTLTLVAAGFGAPYWACLILALTGTFGVNGVRVVRNLVRRCRVTPR